MTTAADHHPAGAPPSTDFLDAMAALAGGVCVVTALAPGGRPVGFTSTAVMSLSREPQLLATAVHRAGRSLPALLAGGRFALNILSGEAAAVSQRFAAPGADRFSGLDWHPDESGLPLLTAHSRYAVICRIEQDLPAGDHRLLIAAVERIVPGAHHEPTALVHHGRRYHALGAHTAA
jgi:flavin reductase (DIM6/NTAB) family NADH-FMN oxidoreductase RutF